MKVLICPDKFKGSLTAQEVADAIYRGLKNHDKSIEVIQQVLADGGEGTLALLESQFQATRVPVQVKDPLFRSIDTFYLRKGDQAIIEMANASGLQLLSQEERNPLKTTSFGTGQMILDAIEKGALEIILTIGGSATNDAGLGMAQALGFDFGLTDEETVGGKLATVSNYSDLNVQKLLDQVQFTVLSDVKNPLLGKDGATYVYGKQKGANEQMQVDLEKGMQHFSELIGSGMELVEGAGAAGGMGYAALTFLNAKIISGIDYIIEQTNLREKAEWADLVITGEGQYDLQTQTGKVISGVQKLCEKLDRPLRIVCGRAVEVDSEDKIYQVINKANDLTDAMENAGYYVQGLTQDLLIDFKA